MLPPWWDVERRETPIEDSDGVVNLFMTTLPELDVFSEQCVPKEHDETRCPACEQAGNDLAMDHKVRNDYGLGWPRPAAQTARYVERNGTGAGTPGDDLELWPHDYGATTSHNHGALLRIAMVMAVLRDRQGVGDGVRTARRRTRRQHDRRSIAGDIAARRRDLDADEFRFAEDNDMLDAPAPAIRSAMLGAAADEERYTGLEQPRSLSVRRRR
jgi:hypothetical protein